MEGKRVRLRQKLVYWMMEDGYWKLEKKAQHLESGVVGHLEPPGGR